MSATQIMYDGLSASPNLSVTRPLVLQAHGIRKHFGGNHVLDGIDLELYRGQVVLLRGDNGTGKTTLINILSGNIEPDAGKIDLRTNGHLARFEFPPRGLNRLIPGFGFSPDRIAREGVGRSWQDIRLFPTLDLQSNIAVAAPNQPGESLFGSLFRTRAVREAETANRAAAADILEELGLNGREASSGDRISLGQSKRVAIARAIHGGAKILFLDEPLAGLDAAGIDQVVGFLRHVAAEDGITLVIVEHVFHIPRILEFADAVWTLAGGKLTVQSPAEVKAATAANKEEHDDINAWLQEVAGDTGSITHEPLPGGAVLTKVVPAGHQPGEVVLEVKDLVVRRGQRTVIGWQRDGRTQGLGFTLRRGELAVLQAPNGWGKTTLMDAIAGLVKPDVGEIKLSDHVLNGSPGWARKQKGMVYVRAQNGGFGSLNIAENQKLHMSTPHGLPKELHLARQAGSLSGGERRLLTLQCALEASGTQVFILDEPFSALSGAYTYNILKRITLHLITATTIIAIPTT